MLLGHCAQAHKKNSILFDQNSENKLSLEYVFIKKIWCYTIWWDILKETIQRLRKKAKIIKRDNRQDMNSRPLGHEANALPHFHCSQAWKKYWPLLRKTFNFKLLHLRKNEKNVSGLKIGLNPTKSFEARD